MSDIGQINMTTRLRQWGLTETLGDGD